SMPAALTGSHFKGIHNGYDQVMKGVMRGTLDAKDAVQVNTALRGSLSALKTEFDVLHKAKVGETLPRVSAPNLIGDLPNQIEDNSGNKIRLMNRRNLALCMVAANAAPRVTFPNPMRAHGAQS